MSSPLRSLPQLANTEEIREDGGSNGSLGEVMIREYMRRRDDRPKLILIAAHPPPRLQQRPLPSRAHRRPRRHAIVAVALFANPKQMYSYHNYSSTRPD